jgi:hypothetical protein
MTKIGARSSGEGVGGRIAIEDVGELRAAEVLRADQGVGAAPTRGRAPCRRRCG